MAVDTWVAAIITGVPGLIAGVVAVLNVRSQSRKMSGDGVARMIAAAGDFAGDVAPQLRELRQRLDQVERREKRRDQLILAHYQWDSTWVPRARAAGIKIPSPPPLWETQEETAR